MAHIAAITHEYDRFVQQRSPDGPKESRYMLFGVLREMARRGHRIQVVVGPAADVSGDLAILHVDTSLVGPEYLALAERFTRTVNAQAVDITKRKVSGALLAKGEAWSGPVIVKSNLNAKGFPEVVHNLAAKERDLPVPHPEAPIMIQYKIFDSLAEVPETAWESPHLVVERFIPETDEEGYAMRAWIFLGERERCTRFVAKDRMIKAESIIRGEPVEVPEEIREARERLGFDYGKFDFVIHEGRPVLLDANKTPGSARAVQSRIEAGMKDLADGLEALLP